MFGCSIGLLCGFDLRRLRLYVSPVALGFRVFGCSLWGPLCRGLDLELFCSSFFCLLFDRGGRGRSPSPLALVNLDHVSHGQVPSSYMCMCAWFLFAHSMLMYACSFVFACVKQLRYGPRTRPYNFIESCQQPTQGRHKTLHCLEPRWQRIMKSYGLVRPCATPVIFC